jgi:hypothetical protein
LDDLPPGGNPLHGLLDWERAAIPLFDAWGDTDRSHRKLAHRGSRIDLVHVSESTVLRVLAEQGLRLPGNPPRGNHQAPVHDAREYALPWFAEQMRSRRCQ